MDLSLNIGFFLISFLSLVAVGGCQIINKYEIGDNDTFTMTCNHSSFSDIKLPDTKFLTRLIMYRQIESKDEEVIGILEALNIYKYQLIKKIPEGRRWLYKYGGQNKVSNMETAYISLMVNDASKKDAGKYWCVANIKETNEDYPSTKFDLKPQGSTVLGYPIINKQMISNSSDSFTITCNDESFRHTAIPSHTPFMSLMMFRTLDMNSETYRIASYKPYDLDEAFSTKIPNGRSWEFDYGGGTYLNNRETTYITMTVNDASCADAGVYKCAANLYESDTFYYSKPFRLETYVTHVAKINPIKVTPSWGMSFNTSHNFVGEKVTMECSYTGSDQVMLIWSLKNMYKQDNQLVEDFEPERVFGRDGCPAYYQRSNKTYVLQPSYWNPVVYCRAVTLKGRYTGFVASIKFMLMENLDLSFLKSKATSIKLEMNATFIVMCVVLATFSSFLQ